MEIMDEMSAITDSLKQFTPTDNYLMIYISRSHSFFYHNPIY